MKKYTEPEKKEFSTNEVLLEILAELKEHNRLLGQIKQDMEAQSDYLSYLAGAKNDESSTGIE